ncbi:ferritin-like fold-containing protein [Saxibacter everestensis]|uniref:Ferritin-like fold-containing protein n=1 Tax=Saxibacter everestensis TaxID=2909229 RepID=A0ABY8QQA4_9MICO|nr:ferritin-like fold-containing protein [Brevibacteriaceae bacterium ZFBP1038]
MSSNPSTGDDTATVHPGSKGVEELLALLAYGELSAFERTATDAQFAPTIADKVVLAKVAATEFSHFELLSVRLAARGVDANAAMERFVKPLQTFHQRTQPRDWHESLMKAYVSDGIVKDFYREISASLDEPTRRLVHEVLSDTEHSGFVIDRLRSAIASDERLGGRLALWGRRLVGEALSQAQGVFQESAGGVTALLASNDSPQPVLLQISAMLNRITEAHSRRMAALDLMA